MRVLVADDEPIARRMLDRLLRSDPEISSIVHCATGSAARHELRRGVIDIALLDIQMPQGDGFEVLEGVADDDRPIVIFVTAHEDHALRAIQSGATDYVLKPFDDDRFRQAMGRAKKAHRSRTLLRHSEELASLLLDAGAGPRPSSSNRLSIHDGTGLRVLEAEEILKIEAADKHVILHTKSETIRVRRTLADFEGQLDAHDFLRVHRSFVVAVDRIQAVESGDGSGATLLMSDGSRVPVSRSRVAAVRARLG